jgi:hypothetical protein
VAGDTTQTATLATIPTGVPIAADVVGTPRAPAAGDRIQYTKTDVGIAGSSDPVTRANPFPVIQGPILLSKQTVNSFRIPGRAGTVGQKLLSLHNATGSTIVVRITDVTCDLVQTVIKAVTVLPPVIRLWKVTVLPTNGTAATKTSRDSGLSASSASVTVLQDASADGTSSASALTATLPAGTVLAQEFAPRFITAAGYEMFDRTEFLKDGEDVVLHALEGLVLFLDYVLAAQNPVTDMWVCGIKWTEAAT